MDGGLQDASVVIVDDDEALRSVVQRALVAEGCHVRAFGTAPEVLASLRETPADLLVADLGLPEMDGLALIALARETDATLPVLVMTGWETAGSAVAAADLGVDGYLRKPCSLKRVTAAARRAVGRRQSERQARAEEAERAAEQARLEALRIIGRSLPHEVHQPLSCIRGYAALLADEHVDPDDVRAYAREIVQAAERLTAVIRRLGSSDHYAVREMGPGNVLLDLDLASTKDSS